METVYSQKRQTQNKNLNKKWGVLDNIIILAALTAVVIISAVLFLRPPVEKEEKLTITYTLKIADMPPVTNASEYSAGLSRFWKIQHNADVRVYNPITDGVGITLGKVESVRIEDVENLGAPEGSAPEGSAPEGSAPEGSAPEGSAPEGSAPGGIGMPTVNIYLTVKTEILYDGIMYYIVDDGKRVPLVLNQTLSVCGNGFLFENAEIYGFKTVQ